MTADIAEHSNLSHWGTCKTCRRDGSLHPSGICRQCTHPGADYVGSVFNGRLVVALVERHIEGNTLWRVRCETCGTEATVRQYRLRGGKCLPCHNANRPARTPEDAAVRATYRLLVSRAKDNDRHLDVPLDEFSRLSALPCHYCGDEGSNTHIVRRRGVAVWTYRYSRLDRADNRLGYVTGNVVPCCKLCNRMKGTMGQDEFVVWLRRAAAWQWSQRKT